MDKKIFNTEDAWDDLGIYSSDARESMMEDDEILPFEEAFMKGYEAEFI